MRPDPRSQIGKPPDVVSGGLGHAVSVNPTTDDATAEGDTTMRGSKHDLPAAVELPDGSTLWHADWGGMTAELGSFNRSADPGPFFKGLPDDRCQCPHWGYVIKGQ